MAFAAVARRRAVAGRGLLLGNLFWVLAYDTEYAMVDRDDDLKIGIKTSAITLGRFDVAAVMAFYAIFLAIWAAIGAGSGSARRTTSASARPRCRRPGTTR
jgi:4-hydroxybenzoate polyprenyltransferase